ncbi:MAG: hypothetical protein EXR70_07115 [Deltaproteobacteria bacterium]|nr:hypothetical protein [Deltaproteobacteria bacterium]
MKSEPPLSFTPFLRWQFAQVFSRPWPVIPSALVIAVLNVFLFAFDRPWTASDGLRNWGDSLFKFVGAIDQPELLPPLLYSGSVLNIGLLLGGFAAALLSREFAIRGAPPVEIAKGAIGGLLMGIGAMLSFGCNIGGFFSALSALSASGLAMMAGLVIGSFAASRLIVWQRVRQIEKGQVSFISPCEAPPPALAASSAFKLQPRLGVFVIVGVIVAGSFYQFLGHGRLALFLYFGVAFGIVFQRSRFCLVNAFREPYLSGQSEHTRAAALALTLSMIGFAILKAGDLKDASEWVFPSFWLGSFFGGTIFGFGMLLAEGCGAGTIWRCGEGHVKLWIALSFFALGASTTRMILLRTDWLRQLGDGVFLPNVLGWTAALWGVAGLMAVWYLLSAWNERRKQVGVFRF